MLLTGACLLGSSRVIVWTITLQGCQTQFMRLVCPFEDYLDTCEEVHLRPGSHSRMRAGKEHQCHPEGHLTTGVIISRWAGYLGRQEDRTGGL